MTARGTHHRLARRPRDSGGGVQPWRRGGSQRSRADERRRLHATRDRDRAVQSQARRSDRYSHHNLTYLDLSGLDSRPPSLPLRSFAVDFTGANLRGADLSNTRLDRTVLIRADLRGRRLERRHDPAADGLYGSGRELERCAELCGREPAGHPRDGEDVGRGLSRRRPDRRQPEPARSAPGQGTITTLAKTC